MKSKWIYGAMTPLVAISLLAGAQAASASVSQESSAPQESSSAQISTEDDSVASAEIRARLKSYGVSDETANSLVNKYESGQPWDSMSGKSPVSEERSISNGKSVVKATFADGSIRVTTADIPTRGVSGYAGVTNCSAGSGSNYHLNYTGCYGSADLIAVQMGFHFDYTSYNGGPGIISRSYDYHHRIVGGDLSDHTLTKVSDQVTRYSAAYSVAFKGFPAGWTVWMEVDVTGDPVVRNN